MNKIVNCADVASNTIENMLNQLEFTQNALEEKRGSNSRGYRNFLIIIYFMGVILFSAFAVVIAKEYFMTADNDFEFMIAIIGSASCAAFLAILIITKAIEQKYYKAIFAGEDKLERISRHLQKIKTESVDYYDLLNNGSIKSDSDIKLGKDVSKAIESINQKTNLLEERTSDIADKALIAAYYVAAISVGAFFILHIQKDFVDTIYGMIAGFGVEDGIASSMAEAFYGICAAVAIFGGPILTKYYFEKIKLVRLKDSLIILIAGSGVLAFIAAVIVVGLVAGIIALVWLIVKTIVSIVIFVVVVIFIIALIAAMLGGG